MNTVGQWVHQHNLLLLCAAAVGGSGLLLLVFRWRSPRLWLLWSGVTASCVAALLSLRTPAASVSEHTDPGPAAASPEGMAPAAALSYSEPDLKTVEAIDGLIAAGAKPTLVEVYSDWGLY